MEIKKLKFDLKKIGLDKWLLIALAGILLVICSIPSSDKKKNNVQPTAANDKYNTITEQEYALSMENRLKELLQSIEGIGRVNVMITLKGTGEKIALKEEPYSKSITDESDSQGGVRKSSELTQDQKVIYMTNENGDSVPYIVKQNEPEIEGIAVIAEGGGNSKKAEQIVRIAEALFSISVHKISVVEMND